MLLNSLNLKIRPLANLTLALLATSSICSCKNKSLNDSSPANNEPIELNCELNSTRQEVIANHMYRVLSNFNHNGSFHESATIYVFKGKAVSGRSHVWVYGAGYGDSGANNDLQDYMDIKSPGQGTWIPKRSAHADALDLHHVITNCLGVTTSNTDFDFIVPHAHVDHFNQEFLTESADVGIQFSKIYVHENEYVQASCGEYFCGSAGPYSPANIYFGVPYKSPITQSTLNKMVQLTGGDCGTPVGALPLIETDGLGNVGVYHDWDSSLPGKKYAHTPGTTILHFADQNISLYGGPIKAGVSFISKCPIPNGHTAFPPHGSSGFMN